jgi:hypothetical protein
MTFEEFFKKKKINLTTLQQAEGTLFAEFKDHFELMGEKSFDHTKKYWFNKLRRQFPAPVEVKAEKVVIENPLAEQTITESLAEPITEEKPKTGFTPRFKAGATAAKPVEPVENTTPPVSEDAATEITKPATTAKPGFTPRFKAGVTAAKTEESTSETKTEEQNTEEPAKPVTTIKPGFTPRFKAGVTKAIIEPASETPKVEEEKPAEPTQPAKVGFTPRFKAGVTKAVTETSVEQPKTEEEKPVEPTQPAKVGFTPRFKAGITKAIPAETPIEPKVEENAAEVLSEPQATEETFSLPSVEEKNAEEKPEPITPPKIGFKPRFKPPQK